MQRSSIIILFLTIFFAGIGLFTRHNDFPFYYHPDEPGKVMQLIQGKRNFHHPMLLLTTADMVRRTVLWGSAKNDPQSVVLVGRWVSAAFAALTAAVLAVLAARLYGAVAGVFAGALVVANPLLFELAHYFKEDPALVAGVALTALALHIFSTRPDRRRIGWLGAALALAASGKYIGFALLPLGVAVVLAAPQSELMPRRAIRIGVMLGVFAGVWLVFNWWIFKSPELIMDSLESETIKAFGSEESARRIPHPYYATVQQSYGGWWTPALALLWFFTALRRIRRTPVPEWVFGGTVVVLVVVLSFTPKTSQRYYLPVSIALSYLAVAGIARTINCPSGSLPALTRRAFRCAGVGALLFTVFIQWSATESRLQSFRSDDRAELVAWVSEHLPANAVIAQDESVNLPEPARRKEHIGRELLPQRVLGKKHVADLGSIAELRAQGVTHIAVSARTYVRYFDPGRGTPTGSRERIFYDTVLNKGRKLWESPMGIITYLQPGLTLVDITSLR